MPSYLHESPCSLRKEEVMEGGDGEEGEENRNETANERRLPYEVHETERLCRRVYSLNVVPKNRGAKEKEKRKNQRSVASRFSFYSKRFVESPNHQIAIAALFQRKNCEESSLSIFRSAGVRGQDPRGSMVIDGARARCSGRCL